MNKSFIIGAALVAAIFAGPVSAGEIDGTVTDAGGVNASGVEVRVRGLDRTTTTDDHGHFHFSDVPPGEYVIEVTGEDVEQVIMVADGIATVRLRLPTVSLGSIQVRASPLRGRSPLDMAQPVSVLAGDELERQSAMTIGETVANQLGVSATNFGPGSSRPVIRGLGDDRVRVLDGGIGTLDVSSVSDDHGVALEPILVDQIEVLRGPATLLYGTGAIGGVVNVVDNRIPERLPVHDIEGRVELRGQSADSEITGAVRLDGQIGGRVAWHVDAWNRRTGNLRIPGFAESAALRALEEEEHDEDEHEGEEEEAFGVVENSDTRVHGGNLGFSWIGRRGFIGLAVSTLDNGYGIPGGHGHHGEEHEDEEHEEEAGHEDEDEVVRIAQRRTRFDVAGAVDDALPGFERLRFRLGVSDYRHVELEGGMTGTVFDNDAWEGRAELTHVPLGEWRGAIGIQASGRAFSAIGAEAFTPPVDSNELGLFVVEERDVGRAKLELGARVERVRHRPSVGPLLEFNLSNFSGGVIVPVAGDIETTLTLGSFQRAPVAEELYSNGPHLATGTFDVGDPTLRPERSTAIEVGLRDQVGDWRWSVSYFRNEFDRFIFQQDAGFEDPDSELPVLQYAQQDATFTGVEAELEGTLVDSSWGQLRVRLFTDSVRATLADGTPVPRIPPQRHGVALTFMRDAWFGRLGWTRHDSQSRVAPGELPTPGYDMLDFDLDYSIYSDFGTWSLFLRGTNLLDEDARRHASFLKDRVPLAGRSVRVGARLVF